MIAACLNGVLCESWQLLLVLAPVLSLLGSLSGSCVCSSERIFRIIGDDSYWEIQGAGCSLQSDSTVGAGSQLQ